MPPKRKAAAAKAGGKKAKKGEAAGPATMKDVASALKAEDKKSGGKKIHSVDKMCHLSNAGAQGESGMNSLKPQPDLAAAAKDFEKKYQDKTKNKWADRAKFTPVPGKYTPIEMAYENEVDAPMPSKRKEAAAKAGGKKAKKGEAAGPATMKDVASALKAEDTKSRGKKIHSVDKMCHLSNAYAQIADDYDCMLNQTNIGFNNNKYYIIQVLQCCGTHYTWNRWGRVGESGTNSLKAQPDLAAAAKDFEKKYRDKTKNKWADRAKFTQVPGKYTLIEMAYEDEVDAPVPLIVGKPGHKVAESALDKTTQALIKLIFDNDMFNECMKKFDIDVKKMPLGKLSKGQIAKGFDVLDEIEKEIDANRTAKLNQLSSTFYTVIPHNFGRKIPPPIKDIETLRSKMDMLLVLGDIEVAQSLQKEKDKRMEAGGDKAPNPLDMNYDLLNCQLELMDKLGSEYMMLDKYTKETSGGWRTPKIKSIWKVNRDGESSRFKVHDKLGNRKLLWHGTNVAVVAAILKGGLRIMPHSGGSVGSGIYFASENSKSADYVGTVGSMGIMFLNEVVLGKEKHVFANQFHLKAAPTGFDSVLAVGQTEPNPKQNQTFKIDGKDVVVPLGKPINVKTASHSHFSQSEYLIYKESQSRIRYLLLMDF